MFGYFRGGGLREVRSVLEITDEHLKHRTKPKRDEPTSLPGQHAEQRLCHFRVEKRCLSVAKNTDVTSSSNGQIRPQATDATNSQGKQGRENSLEPSFIKELPQNTQVTQGKVARIRFIYPANARLNIYPAQQPSWGMAPPGHRREE